MEVRILPGDPGRPPGRSLLRAGGRGLLALALLAACAPEPGPEPARPNLVVFLIDTLRADRLGSYGHSAASSPAIDALAERGVLFEQASASSPWTLPSVASLFTARHVVEHGVVVDGDRLDPGIETLAERLRSEGYATASFFVNPYAGPMSELDRGFEVAEKVKGAVGGERVRRWLEHEAEAPFLLYVHNMEPHRPWATKARHREHFAPVSDRLRRRARWATDRYRALSRVDFTAGHPRGTTDNTAAQRELLSILDDLRPAYERLYDASVRQADARVREVVEALREAGAWEETLFVLLSDHGEEFGEHGGWHHDQSLYQELIRIPLVIRLPGDRHGGTRVARPVSLVDLAPTLLDAAGLERGSAFPSGRSLLPLSAEGAGAAERRVVAMRANRKKYFRPWERARGDLNVAVREGRYKGILNVEPGRFELYDLRADPEERRDLAAERPERAERLEAFARRRLGELAEASGAKGALERVDEETREALRALGYVDDEAP